MIRTGRGEQIDTHVHLDAHFDPNGKSHSPASAKNETAQRSMLYAVENAHNVLMAGFTTVQSVGAPLDDYDPNFGLLLHNYIENKEKFLEVGNFNAQGFEYR